MMMEIKKEDYTAITMETLCFAIIGSNVYINVEEQIAYYVGRESKTLSGQKKEPLKVSQIDWVKIGISEQNIFQDNYT